MTELCPQFDAARGAPIHFTFITSDEYIVAACGASGRFDARFKSSEKLEGVTCPDCLAHTETTK